MSEYEEKPKQPKATEVIANQPRRDNPSDKYGGNPHMQPGELQDSETWKSHKSHKPAKQNPAKKSA
jgi:hypothetical protein